MKNKALLATIIGSLALVGCGGGSSGGSSDTGGGSSPTTLSGHAIDGYIQGATVFLDKNFNGALDSGELSATTNENGEYSLDLSNEACKQSAPLVVRVPVGAIDLDDPNNSVSEAYTLTMPPKTHIVAGIDTSDAHVTPMTSLIWNKVLIQAENEGVVLDCAEIATANSEQSNWLSDKLVSAEKEVAESYGVSNSADLYADYVEESIMIDEDNNPSTAPTNMHDTAKAIVEDLKEVEKVKDTAPTGSEVYLLDRSILAEYGITDTTKSYVLTKTVSGETITETVTETEDSSQVHYKVEATLKEDSSYRHYKGKTFVRGTGICEESIESKDKSGSGYEVLTASQKGSATSISDCASYDTETQVVKAVKSKKTETNPVEGFYYTTTETTKLNYDDHTALVSTQEFSNLENFFAEVEANMGAEVDFESDVVTATSWTKTYVEDHTTEFNGGENNIKVYRDNSNIWYKINRDNVSEYFCEGEYMITSNEELMIDHWENKFFGGDSKAVWHKIPGTNTTEENVREICKIHYDNVKGN